MSPPSDAYQDIPYESRSCPQSHPANLAVIATLFGMRPQTLEAARVLEIGCAGGGNLLPMAAAFPACRFVGVDLSPSQIAEAKAAASALRLTNIEFHAMSFEAMEAKTFGAFDYLIAHGVYSWVAAPVREQLLAVCSKLLSPQGVAYVSYNTLPGSSTRAALREMLKFHLPAEASLTERVRRARGFFAFLGTALEGREDGYALAMRAELSQIAALGDFYIAHEHLEESNDPCYFHDFISHARRHGLQFLAEAEIHTMSTAGFPQAVKAGLRDMASSIEEAEQYGDFVRDRAFRQTLLCRADLTLNRAIPSGRVQQFQISSSLEPLAESSPGGAAEGQFRDAEGMIIKARDPLTHAALLELRAVWPGSVSFADLLAKAAGRARLDPGQPQTAALLANSLLTCYSTSRAVEFHLQPVRCFISVSAFPATSGLIRWQATNGLQVTNLRHENILLRGPEANLLQKLDGTRSLPSLEAEFEFARIILERFAQLALLIS